MTNGADYNAIEVLLHTNGGSKAASDREMLETVFLGKVVRQRRRALGWTLEQLAERAGLTPNYVGALERDAHRDPSLSTVVALAQAFRIAPGELLGGVRGLSSEAVEAGRLFEGTAPDVQDAVLRLLRATARRRR